MRALSVRQPWAWLIVNGYKPVENRTWRTGMVGPIYIHAGLRFDRAGYDWVRAEFPEIPLPDPSEFAHGGVVGTVRLIGCVDRSDSRWFEGPHGFVLEDPTPLPLRRCPGRLGFFDPHFTDIED